MIKSNLKFINSPIFEALRQQQIALEKDEVPVGAAIAKNGLIIASAHNLVETNKDMCAHAEYLAMREASVVLNTKYLYECELYTTLEPCIFCASAAKLFRIKTIHFCAEDIRWGTLNQSLELNKIGNHNCQYTKLEGLEENGKILSDFFKRKRNSR